MKVTIKIGGETRFQRILPEVTPEVTLIDKGVVGNIQSFQCTVCEALLSCHQTLFKNNSRTKQVVCGICGSKLQARAALPSGGTWCCYPSSVLVAAAIKKAQVSSVEVFDVDSNQTEQVARTDVEPAPKRHKGTFTEKLQTKLNEWTLEDMR